MPESQWYASCGCWQGNWRPYQHWNSKRLVLLCFCFGLQSIFCLEASHCYGLLYYRWIFSHHWASSFETFQWKSVEANVILSVWPLLIENATLWFKMHYQDFLWVFAELECVALKNFILCSSIRPSELMSLLSFTFGRYIRRFCPFLLLLIWKLRFCRGITFCICFLDFRFGYKFLLKALLMKKDKWECRVIHDWWKDKMRIKIKNGHL